jgi:hypothetical protein
MRRLVFLAILLPAIGCADTKQCEAFAEHLAEVVASETKEPVDPDSARRAEWAEVRGKMVKQTVDACVADPPDEQALDCALAAESSAAMKLCDVP